MKEKIIAHGAEAKIILKDGFVIKDRIKKSYRIKELDEKIRKSRTKAEEKIMLKASEIINVPRPKMIGDNKLEIELVDGKKLSQYLDSFEFGKQKRICEEIGKEVSKMHKESIIHGDLTTSNMIWGSDKIFFIDFGLGFVSHKTEDQAVDLHLLKQALEAKHFKKWQDLWKAVEKGYSSSKDSKKVLERLVAVERRGRYKKGS